jgi:hypothetical protein
MVMIFEGDDILGIQVESGGKKIYNLAKRLMNVFWATS